MNYAPTIQFITDLQGESLYMEWIKAGNEGTTQDFIDWLRSPAIDAAETADALVAALNESEAIRVSSENNRISAEEAREISEGLRETNTSTAIQNAENATEAANQAASDAPAPVTLHAIVTSVLPDASGFPIGRKIYSSFYKLIYTRIISPSNGAPAWSDGVSPRWQDVYTFEENFYQWLNGDLVSADKTALAAVALAAEKASFADDKATLANDAAILADQKATLADSKATLADQKATLANDAATLANTATTNANAATASVNEAVLSASMLGGIAYNASAPTPGKTGWFEFISGGVCSWLIGTPTVKISDRVIVNFTSPSTYTYTYVNVMDGKASIKTVILSNQLIDLDNAQWVAGQYLNGSSTANQSDYTYTSAYSDVSDLAGQVVYSRFFNVAQYDANKTYISNTYTGGGGSLTLAANCKYIRCSASLGAAYMTDQTTIIARAKNQTLIVLKGSTYTGSQYDTFSKCINIIDANFKITNDQLPAVLVLPNNVITLGNISDGLITPAKLTSDFQTTILNKANIKKFITSNQLIDLDGSTWVVSQILNGSGTTAYPDYTYCNEYQDVSDYSGQNIYSSFFRVVQYDINKVFISNTDTWNTHTLTLASNCKYVRVSANIGISYMTNLSTIIARLKSISQIVLLGNSFTQNQFDNFTYQIRIINSNFRITNDQLPFPLSIPANSIPTLAVIDNAITTEKLSLGVQTSITEKIKGSQGKNLFDITKATTGQYINEQGLITLFPVDPGYSTSGFIQISNGQILKCNSVHGYANIALYDANYAVISGSVVSTNSQSYIIGTSASTYARFTINNDANTKFMVAIQIESVATISSLSTEFEPFQNVDEIVKPYSFEDSRLHPVLKSIFPYYGLKWYSMTDSIGIDGVTYTSSNLLWTRDANYAWRSGQGYFGWQRYLGDYLQLGGHTVDAVGGATIAINTGGVNTQYFTTATRINAIPVDEKLVVIMGGTNDHYYASPIGDMTYNSGYNENSFKGGLASLITKIHTRCPDALIVYLTPLYASRNANGSSTPINTLGLSLKDYRDAAIDVCQRMGTPYIDVYAESGINERNWAEYLISDGVHPFTSKGMAKLATCILAGLNRFRPNLTELTYI